VNPLELLAEHSAEGFPNLFQAREHTARRLTETRGHLAGTDHDRDASVVFFGSWGRQELTNHSDDDWAILVAGSERSAVNPQSAQIGELLGVDGRKPGSQGVFGCAFFCQNLVERIGLDEDDNKNLTRRMLLLLESVAVLNKAPLDQCWHAVLEGYLDDSVKGYRPPRFLLNDMIRYWRTVCVDFVGKERAGTEEKWALRNLKLRLSRKALFAGGLLPVLLCHRYAIGDIRPFLAESLRQPSIDRVASAFLDLGAVDAGVRAITAYDRFIGMLGDSDSRLELERLSKAEADDSHLFHEGKRLGADFQQGVLALLFETSLKPLVREYGIF
jgi:hypothetical protein